MTRTIKTDQPPIKMTIEGGRLVPASAYDAERLDSYRRGATLNVFITHEKQRVDEKKWWAALNRAVKQCKTPWKNSSQASEAIKLAIGVVNYTKTVAGNFMQYPKSLTELDDAELGDAVRQLFDVLHGVTGVDPAEWRRQTADIREDPDETNSQQASGLIPSTGACGSDVPPPGVAADLSANAAAGVGSSESADGQTELPAPDERALVNSAKSNFAALKAEMVRKVLQLAGDDKLTVQQRLENLDVIRPGWEEHIQGFPGLVRQVFDTAGKMVRGDLKPDAGKQFIERLL